MILLGLTGSIGMGKSTTARLFAEEGVPVFDSDAAVHRLYAAGGAAVAPVEAAFPGVGRHGHIDRRELSARMIADPDGLETLEVIVHPLVAAEREKLLDHARLAGAAVAVLDIPLLFETGAESEMDAVVVVTAPANVQRDRVLARPGMSEAKFAAILDRQTPDAEKRARADFVIKTGHGLGPARDEVRRILKLVAAPGWRSRRDAASPGPLARSDPEKPHGA